MGGTFPPTFQICPRNTCLKQFAGPPCLQNKARAHSGCEKAPPDRLQSHVPRSVPCVCCHGRTARLVVVVWIHRPLPLEPSNTPTLAHPSPSLSTPVAFLVLKEPGSSKTVSGAGSELSQLFLGQILHKSRSPQESLQTCYSHLNELLALSHSDSPLVKHFYAWNRVLTTTYSVTEESRECSLLK